MDFLTYIGHAAERVISKEDLASLGAEAHQLATLAEGQVLKFVNGVATEVDTEVAHFIANHPDLTGEFEHSGTDVSPTPVTPSATGDAGTPSTPTETTAAPAAEAAPEHPTA